MKGDQADADRHCKRGRALRPGSREKEMQVGRGEAARGFVLGRHTAFIAHPLGKCLRHLTNLTWKH